MSSWSALSEELSLWQEQQLVPDLWWRDDDAQMNSPALSRLCQLSTEYDIPVALAVIPKGVQESLVTAVSETPSLFVLLHGYSHANHAPADQRKCELGYHRPQVEILTELQRGLEQLSGLFVQSRFLPVLVPPWNRLSATLVSALPKIGVIGLSTLGSRSATDSSQLIQNNVHVDIMDWKTRRYAGDERVLEQLVRHLRQRRIGQCDNRETTGLMTHHLVHDEAGWEFCQRLFEFSCEHGVKWKAPTELFGGE